MIIYSGKRKIDIGEVKSLGFFGRFIGLMFRSKMSLPLLFSFSKDVSLPIHSFFVFFPFLAVWTDENYRIVDSKVVYPFSFSVSSKKPFRHLIELPCAGKQAKRFAFLVGKG